MHIPLRSAYCGRPPASAGRVRRNGNFFSTYANAGARRPRRPQLRTVRLGRAAAGVLFGRHARELDLEPRECVALELADALARQLQLAADRLERLRLALEPEPQLEDPPLPLGQPVERHPHRLAAKRVV